MANRLPSEVLARSATIRQTVLNGDLAHIALTDKGSVLQLLEQSGHTHSMDDRVLDLMGDD